MSWHRGTDEAITLSFLILGSPFLAQLIHSLHSTHFLPGKFTLVSFATTSGCLSHARPRPLSVFCTLIKHIAFFVLFYCGERLGSTSIVQSVFNKTSIESLLLYCLLDLSNVFILLIGCPVLLQRVFLSEYMLFSSNLFEGLLNVLLN
jgi:hypothetical protein